MSGQDTSRTARAKEPVNPRRYWYHSSKSGAVFWHGMVEVKCVEFCAVRRQEMLKDLAEAEANSDFIPFEAVGC